MELNIKRTTLSYKELGDFVSFVRDGAISFDDSVTKYSGFWEVFGFKLAFATIYAGYEWSGDIDKAYEDLFDIDIVEEYIEPGKVNANQFYEIVKMTQKEIDYYKSVSLSTPASCVN